MSRIVKIYVLLLLVMFTVSTWPLWAKEKAPERVVIWAPGTGGTVKDWDNNPILQAIEKATNTDIKITWIDWAAYNDKLNAAAAAGEFPDIACTVNHMAKTMLRTWIDGGIIAPVEGPIAKAAPNWINMYKRNKYLAELKFDDKIYLLPVGWGEGRAPNMGLVHVRKDLLDKFGMRPPDKWDQYVNYLRRCVSVEKINGVVFAAKAGFPDTALNVVLGSYGLPFRGWIRKGGRYEFWAVQPEVGEALTYFRKLFAEGLIDPGVWEYTGEDARTVYVSGKAGSFIFNGGGHIGRIQNDMSLINPKFKEWLLPALDFGRGKRGYTQEDQYWGATVIGGGRHNNPVAAARVINYLISEEGYRLTAIGIEGVHYRKEGDKIIWLPARFKDGFPTEAGDAGAHPLAFAIVSWQPQKWQDFTLLYGKDEEYKKWYYSMWRNQLKYQIPTYGIAATCPEWEKFQAKSSDLLSRALTEAVRTNSDKETIDRWNKFIKEWYTSGGEEATEGMTKVLKKLYGG